MRSMQGNPFLLFLFLSPVFAAYIPPNNPPANIQPNPDFFSYCGSSDEINNSETCTNDALEATNYARSLENVSAMILPTNYANLTAAEQLFVVANMERVGRGLPEMNGLVSSYNSYCQTGADDDNDPNGPTSNYITWGSNWAGGYRSVLGANYGWMYMDGPGGDNLDCTQNDTSGCWGHRDNILGDYTSGGGTPLMGAASSLSATTSPSLTQLFVEYSGSTSQPMVYTWQDVLENMPPPTTTSTTSSTTSTTSSSTSSTTSSTTSTTSSTTSTTSSSSSESSSTTSSSSSESSTQAVISTSSDITTGATSGNVTGNGLETSGQSTAESAGSNNKTIAIIASVCSVSAVMGVGVVAFIVYKRKRNRSYTNQNDLIDNNNNNNNNNNGFPLLTSNQNPPPCPSSPPTQINRSSPPPPPYKPPPPLSKQNALPLPPPPPFPPKRQSPESSGPVKQRVQPPLPPQRPLPNRIQDKPEIAPKVPDRPLAKSELPMRINNQRDRSSPGPSESSGAPQRPKRLNQSSATAGQPKQQEESANLPRKPYQSPPLTSSSPCPPKNRRDQSPPPPPKRRDLPPLTPKQ